jgi:prevent-host-death family protein
VVIVKDVSVTEGKKNFTSLIALSEKGELIRVMKRNKPVAIIVPHHEYYRIRKILNYVTMKSIADELKGGAPAVSALLEESRQSLEARHDDGR